MADWHFFEGVRGEWRWYRVDDAGDVMREGRQGYAELSRCMDDAREFGFSDSEFAVHARSNLPQFPRRRQGAGAGMLERRRPAKGKSHAAGYTGVERRRHGARDASKGRA